MVYRTSHVLAAAATLALIVSALALVHSTKQLQHARSDVSALHVQLDQLRGQMPQIAQQAQYRQAQAEVQEMVERIGLDPKRWANSRIQRSAEVMSREEAAALLQQQIGGAGQWFVADRFDVSVTQQGDGLFTPPHGPKSALNVEIAGAVFFHLNR